MVDPVTLSLAGAAYEGWTAFQVMRDIETLAGTFELTLTERHPGRPSARPISPDDACTVKIGGDTVITGHVDAVSPRFDASGHEVTVNGRDVTGALVDCSVTHKPGEWKGRRLEQIASDLVSPFGITVRAAAGTGKAFDSFRVQEGETVYEALRRLSRARGVLPISDSLGSLVLTRSAQAARVADRLTRGAKGNILAATGEYDHRERFSKYEVKGQSSGADWKTPADNGQGIGRATDNGVRRFRPLVVIAEEQGDGPTFADRAKWEASVRAGRARRATVTVQGFRDRAGELWRPNTLVPVSDDWLAIDREMLITGVRYIRDERGSRTDLRISHPAAFDLLPIPDDDEVGW